METVNTFIQNANPYIMIIGFIFIGIWQRHQIKAQREQITSQEGLINNIKQFYEIFNIQKVREYTKLREETIEEKKNLEIEKIETELKNKLQEKTEEIEYSREMFLDHTGWLLNTLFLMIVFVNTNSRKKVLDKVEDNFYKPHVENFCNQVPYEEDPNVIKLTVHSASHSHTSRQMDIKHQASSKTDSISGS